MKNEKKYPGVYLDSKTGKYYVSTTFMTKDGYAIKKCKRGFDTAKKADAWKNQTTIEYSNTYYETTHNVKKGIEKLIYEYLDYKKAKTKPSSLKSIKHNLLLHFLPYFKNEAKDIKTVDITFAYQKLADDIKTKNVTKNKIIATILGFVEYLDITESIDSKTYRTFKRVFTKFDASVDKKEIEIYTQEEIKNILTSFDTSTKRGLRDKIAFSILAKTGCRFGECLGLKFGDLNFEKNTLRFDKQCLESIDDNLIRKNIKYEKVGESLIFFYTKTNSTKEVIIPEWISEMILEYKQLLKKDDEDYIFRNRKSIISRHALYGSLDRVLKSLGYTHKRIHSFRHSHTTELYDLGFDPKYIADRLGHADETTSLKVYKHLSKEIKEKNDEMAVKLLN